MGLFKTHNKGQQEATTNAGAHIPELTAKDADPKTLNPSKNQQLPTSSNTAPTQRKPDSFGAGPEGEMWSGNEAIITPGAPEKEELGHQNDTEQKQKHHFWNKHNKDHASGEHKPSKTAWPEDGDPLGRPNLGQGLTWR